MNQLQEYTMNESKVNDRKRFFLRCRTNFWVPKEKAERLKEERMNKKEEITIPLPSFSQKKQGGTEVYQFMWGSKLPSRHSFLEIMEFLPLSRDAFPILLTLM